MSAKQGKLYVVATPIGNLADFTQRGIDVLKQVDCIAAEDTRHIRRLLKHYGISNKVVAFHQHNEQKMTPQLLEQIQAGQSIALVSDAGTPLLSDPGMPLVKMARQAGLDVSPIPGACALIAALSAAGLPTSRFIFEGFIPRTAAARQTFFEQRLNLQTTWMFYESCHRIVDTLRDMATILPPERRIVVARELTKLHETIVSGPVQEILRRVEQDANMRRGEFVVIVDAAAADENLAQGISADQERVLAILLKQCSIKTAVSLAAEICGGRKKAFYQAALRLTGKN